MNIPKQLILRICDKTIEWCFYALLLVTAFSNSLVEAAIAILIAAWVIKKILDRDLRSINSFPVKLMALVWLWTILSCFNSGYFSESLRGVFKILKYGMVFIIASAELGKEKYVKRALAVFTLAAVIVSVNGFYQYFAGVDLLRHREIQPGEAMRRISSSFAHPNDFGVYLLVISMVFISSFVSRASRFYIKARSFGAFLISAAALFLTKSRGAWASFCAGLVVLGAMKSKKVVMVFIALLVAGIFFAPAGVRDRISGSFDVRKGTTWERMKLWQGTIEMIKVHPVLGFGVNTYSRNFPKYKPADYKDDRYAHNCYLQMAAETGIPGAAIFIFFLVSTFVLLSKRISSMAEGVRKDLSSGVFAGLVGFALNSAVDTHLYSVTLATFFYLLLGFCLALTGHNYEK